MTISSIKMGCVTAWTGSRVADCDRYERAISCGQKLLGWSKANVSDLIYNLKKYSKSSQISYDALIIAASCSNINVTKMNDRNTFSGQFFQRLMGAIGNKRKYGISTLSLLSIFLWKGSEEVKAAELFEVYDTHVERNLNDKQVQELFKDFITCATVIMPLIGIGEEDSDLVPQEFMKYYQQSLSKNIQVCTNHLVNLFMQNQQSISIENFVKKMKKRKNTIFLNASTLRNFVLFQVSNSTPFVPYKCPQLQHQKRFFDYKRIIVLAKSLKPSEVSVHNSNESLDSGELSLHDLS